MRLALGLYLGMLAAGSAGAQPADRLPDRGEALVATRSSTFGFYSERVTSLHDLTKPRVYSEGVFERSPAHRKALERVWTPYVNGRLPMAEAVKQLVEALPQESR